MPTILIITKLTPKSIYLYGIDETGYSYNLLFFWTNMRASNASVWNIDIL